QTIAPAHDDPLGQSVGEAECRAHIAPASRKDVAASGASGSRAHIFDGAQPSSEVWIWLVGIEVGQSVLIFEIRRVAAPANTVVQGQAARDLPRVLRKCAHVVSGGNGDKHRTQAGAIDVPEQETGKTVADITSECLAGNGRRSRGEVECAASVVVLRRFVI